MVGGPPRGKFFARFSDTSKRQWLSPQTQQQQQQQQQQIYRVRQKNVSVYCFRS
jgi:hypothetical protein